MNAAGCDSDKGIACFDVCSGDKILLIYHANCEAGQIVLIFRIKARHLGSLAADQSCIGLDAAVSHTFYDGSDFLRIVLAAGNVVKEEQGLCTAADYIVYAHSDAVDTDRVMFVH